MSEPLRSDTLRFGVFERPFADFTLRSTLQEITGRRAHPVMAIPSRFVVLIPVLTPSYVRCESLDEVRAVITAARNALRLRGVRHMYVDHSVHPETLPTLLQVVAGIEAAARPPAANDP